MDRPHRGLRALPLAAVLAIGLAPLLGACDEAPDASPARRSTRLLTAKVSESRGHGGVFRHFVEAPVPSDLRETVRVPETGQLLVGFGIGLDDASKKRRVRRSAVDLAITASTGVEGASAKNGGETRLVRFRMPAAEAGSSWHEGLVDLSPYAGQQIELSFRARAAGGGDASGLRVRWQVPVLHEAMQPGDPPNVIVLALDTLRADHLGSYGYENDTAPAIASLAARGVVFEQAFSQAPWTLPSFASIFTGLRPARHGVVHGRRAVSPHVRTLPAILRDAGYYTAGFHDGGYLSHAHGFHHSFDLYEQIKGLRSMPRVLQWLREHQSLPFFLLVHSYDVHAPYGSVPTGYLPKTSGSGAPSRFDLLHEKPMDVVRRLERQPFSESDFETMRELYDAEIRFVDDQLDRLFRLLDELHLRESTLVVVMSDHGEEFGEHGNVEHHNGHVFRELCHVPLVISGPGIARGRRIEELVETVDLLPTVLELLGIDAGAAGDVDGSSFAGLLSLQERLPDAAAEGVKRYAFSQTHDSGGARALRTRDWTLIESASDGLRLYDRQADPGEIVDVAHEHADVVERLAPLLAELAAGRPRDDASMDAIADEATQAELRALGYIE